MRQLESSTYRTRFRAKKKKKKKKGQKHGPQHIIRNIRRSPSQSIAGAGVFTLAFRFSGRNVSNLRSLII
jgi:hypothetical protein